MRAVFYKKSDKTHLLYEYSQITDIDISYYDDVLLSKAMVPEFRISFFYAHEHERTSGELRSFSQWWDNFAQNNDFRDLYIRVFDSNDDLLADGEVFEYEEKLSSFCVEFICQPDLSQILESGAVNKYNVNFDYSMENADKTLIWVREIFYTEMTRAYNWTGLDIVKYKIPLKWKGNNAHFDFLAKPILDVLATFDNQFTNYVLRFKFNEFRSTPIKDVLREISKFFRVKIIYSTLDKCFNIIPFIDESGVNITGYVDSIYHRVVEVSDKQNLYKKIESCYKNSSKQYQDYTDMVNEIVNPSLTWIGKEKAYRIWGYCGKLLTTGNVINLNSKRYIINEISYELSSLDSVKSFNAVCSLL